jgi:hypothetical protein
VGEGKRRRRGGDGAAGGVWVSLSMHSFPLQQAHAHMQKSLLLLRAAPIAGAARGAGRPGGAQPALRECPSPMQPRGRKRERKWEWRRERELGEAEGGRERKAQLHERKQERVGQEREVVRGMRGGGLTFSSCCAREAFSAAYASSLEHAWVRVSLVLRPWAWRGRGVGG